MASCVRACIGRPPKTNTYTLTLAPEAHAFGAFFFFGSDFFRGNRVDDMNPTVIVALSVAIDHTLSAQTVNDWIEQFDTRQTVKRLVPLTRSSRRRSWPIAVVVAAATLCLMVGLSSGAAAQTPSGVIAGAIADAQGGVVPGATVTVKSAETGAVRWARRQKGEIASSPAISGARVFVSSATHQVGMAAVAATWPTSGVRVVVLPVWRASLANWAELITAAPPGSLLK